MGHYALLDQNDIVFRVIVGKDESEGEYNWESFYGKIHEVRCKRTSYNTQGGIHLNGGFPFRKNYAGIGYFYDEIRDAFIPPKPYQSWILNEDTCLWESPVEIPDDGKKYTWNEEYQSWIEIS